MGGMSRFGGSGRTTGRYVHSGLSRLHACNAACWQLRCAPGILYYAGGDAALPACTCGSVRHVFCMPVCSRVRFIFSVNKNSAPPLSHRACWRPLPRSCGRPAPAASASAKQPLAPVSGGNKLCLRRNLDSDRPTGMTAFYLGIRQDGSGAVLCGRRR